VDVVSLGFRTDLMLRRLAGAIIVDRTRYLAVRTPANPGFWWGNFLLFPGPPRPADTPGWLAAFVAEFPGAVHLAFGVDGTSGDYGSEAGLAGLGVSAQVSTVLTARSLRPLAGPGAGATCRPVESDDDWAQVARLHLACDDHGSDPGQRLFNERWLDEVRDLCRRGRGAWFGAFAGGQMRSGCGIFSDGAGIARFQSVETEPGYRCRGLASQVVHAAGRHALARLGARTLVIVAGAGSAAGRIYRALGFTDAERQVELQRTPRP
jgi:ribosomal protein S18 acetylase RimI-like enzyme